MKRRAMILLLVLAMMVSMFPMTASAATTRTASASCIELIKHFEGFYAKPYWDYKQYTIGYGTKCPDDKVSYYQQHGISKAEAQKMLESQLKSYVASVNKFADKYDLELTQYQFDALVSFTYNVGASWTNGAATQLFTQYVLAGKTGNEFIFAMTLWSNAGGSTSKGLVERRLIEANLYLNGVYAKTVPSNYNYVLFNHSTSNYAGKTRAIRVVGYDSNLADPVLPEGTKSGYRFLGWYTSASGGEWIDALTAKQDGKTLYAHWQKGEGNVDASGNILGTTASYSRIAASGMKIYSQPGENGKVSGSVKRGATMNIVADYITANGVKWGRLKQGGWVCLDTTETETPQPPAPDQVIATGTVKASIGSLNVREEANTSSKLVGFVQAGERVELYEIITVGSTQWGRTAEGWISLKYVDLDTGTEEPTEPEETEPEQTEPEQTEPEQTKPAEKVVAQGMVTLSSGTLSIRSGAGATYSRVGTLENGSIVEFYEIVTANGSKWGRMAEGWVCMDYVQEGQAETIAVSSVNIRKGAGSSYALVGTYQKGQTVYIYETTKVGSATWGLSDKGWFNLDYARKSDDTDKTEETVIATGKVTVSSLNIRKGAGTGYAVLGTYQKDDTVELYETVKSGSATWGRTDKGWISLSGVQLDSDQEEPKQEETVIATGKVTADSLNIRKAAGASNALVGTYKKGDAVKIYETAKSGSSTWGRTDKGWINLNSVQLDSDQEEPKQEEKVIATGKVTMDSLNIRKGAGASNALVGSYKKGETVELYETVKSGSSTWGRTDKGWINLVGVKLDSDQEDTKQEEKVVATGKVTANSLNIRKGAGTGYAVVGTYKKGETVELYETAKANSITWGRTDKGWIGLNNVQLDDEQEEKVIATGKITADALNIREGAGSSYAVVGSYKQGETVKVYETVKDGSVTWARTDKGWVSMQYVQTGNSASSAAVRTGTVNISGSLNVRKGAGTSYAKVDSLQSGTKVTITELKLVSGTPWGRISSGWVNLDYVKLSGPSAGTPALVMGSGLNIREGAGTSYGVTDQYELGTVITILATKTSGGTPWGRTDKGWVSMDFVL